MVAPLQSASGATTNGLTVHATFGSNLSSGSKILAWIVATNLSSATPISTVKDTAGNSLTRAATPVSGSSGGNVSAMLYFLDVPAGDIGGTTIITATFTGTSADLAIYVQEVPGLLAGNTTACLDSGGVAGVEETPSASQAQPAYTSHASGEYLTSALLDNGNSVTWALPGYNITDANLIQGSPTADLVVGYKASTNGAETGTWGATGTPTGSVLLVAAFQLTAGGAAVPAPSRPPVVAPGWFPGAPGTPGGEPFTPWPLYELEGAEVTPALPVSPAVMQPARAPQWLPGLPGLPGGTPFQAWPLWEGPALPSTTVPGAATLTGTGTLTAGGASVTSDYYTASYTYAYGGAEQGPAAVPVAQPIPPDVLPGLPGGVAFEAWPVWQGAALPAAAAAIPGAATLTGTGTLTAAAVQGAGATLTGSGTLASPAVQGAGATLTGTGTLTAAGTAVVPGAAVLTATGTLTAAATQTGAAALTGTGALTAAAVQGATAALTGLGTLTATGGAPGAGAAVLTGTGTLTAAATQRATATLTGTGTLTGAATQTGAATLTGLGALTAAGAAIGVGAANLTGLGTLTAKATQGSNAALTGLGTLTALALQQATAALAGLGALTAAGTVAASAHNAVSVPVVAGAVHGSTVTGSTHGSTVTELASVTPAVSGG